MITSATTPDPAFAAYVAAIVRQVAALRGVAPAAIIGRPRNVPVTEARFLVWLILHRHGHSRQVIATAFSRDIGTVTNGIGRAIDILVEGGTDLSDAIHRIAATVRPPKPQAPPAPPAPVGRPPGSSARAVGTRAGVSEKKAAAALNRTARDQDGNIISGPGTFQDVHRACHTWLMRRDEHYRKAWLAGQAERDAKKARRSRPDPATPTSSPAHRFAGY